MNISPTSPFLNIRVCSNSTFLTNIPIQNNARGILVNISSSLLNVISPTNPFLNIRVIENLAFQLRLPTLNNVRGSIRSLDRLAIGVRLITIDERFPDKANHLIKRGAESDGSLLLKNNNKMAELPKDIIPSVEFGFFIERENLW